MGAIQGNPTSVEVSVPAKGTHFEEAKPLTWITEAKTMPPREVAGRVAARQATISKPRTRDLGQKARCSSFGRGQSFWLQAWRS